MLNVFLLSDQKPKADVTVYPGSIINQGDRVMEVTTKTVLAGGVVVINGSILIVKDCAVCVFSNYVLIDDCLMNSSVDLVRIIQHFTLQIRALQKRIVFLEKELAFDKARIQRLVQEVKRSAEVVTAVRKASVVIESRNRELASIDAALFRVANEMSNVNDALLRLIHDLDHCRIDHDEFTMRKRALRDKQRALSEELGALRVRRGQLGNAPPV